MQKTTKLTIFFICIFCLLANVGCSGCQERDVSKAKNGKQVTMKRTTKSKEPFKLKTGSQSMKTWGFEELQPGEMPKEFTLAVTGRPVLEPAQWSLVTEKAGIVGDKAFGITSNGGAKKSINVALVTDSKYTNVDMNVYMIAVSGTDAQGGGPVWRAQNKDNFYFASWDPQSKLYSINLVVDGVKKTIAKSKTSYDVNKWHTIRIRMEENKIYAWINRDKLMEVEDDTFKTGMIGIAAEANAITYFDFLRAREVLK